MPQHFSLQFLLFLYDRRSVTLPCREHPSPYISNAFAVTCFPALALPLSLPLDATGPLSVLSLPPALPRCHFFCVFSVSTSLYCGLYLCSGRHTHHRGLILATLVLITCISWHFQTASRRSRSLYCVSRLRGLDRQEDQGW